MLIVVLEMIGFICKVSSNLVWMLRLTWEVLQAFVEALSDLNLQGLSSRSRDTHTTRLSSSKPAEGKGQSSLPTVGQELLSPDTAEVEGPGSIPTVGHELGGHPSRLQTGGRCARRRVSRCRKGNLHRRV